jgi:hypothetical protein
MFRYVLSLTFAVSLASAGTISTTATCDGVTTFGTFSARCDDRFSLAEADLGTPSEGFPGGTFIVNVGAVKGIGPPIGLGSASASASFSNDYVFTITGGTGDGFFYPCISSQENGGATGGMSFGGIELIIFGAETCGLAPRAAPKPFTFGVPQIVHITMGASVSPAAFGREAGGTAFLREILFFDPSGNQLSGVTYTLVPAPAPEPSALSSLSVGVMFFAAVWFGCRHFSSASTFSQSK